MSNTFRIYKSNDKSFSFTAFVGPEGNRLSTQITIADDNAILYYQLLETQTKYINEFLERSINNKMFNAICVNAYLEDDPRKLLIIINTQTEVIFSTIAIEHYNSNKPGDSMSFIFKKKVVPDIIQCLENRLNLKDGFTATGSDRNMSDTIYNYDTEE